VTLEIFVLCWDTDNLKTQIYCHNMKFLWQPIYFVVALAFMQQCTYVECNLFNLDIVGQIRDTINKVVFHKHKQETVSTPQASTLLTTVQPTYDTNPSAGVQPQGVSTTTQDPVNATVPEVETRAMIDAPLINGKCEDGYKIANGRCRKVFGRRRRRR
jgi:hypothetical protein